MPFKVYPWLQPLAAIFHTGVCIRNLCFNLGLIRSRSYPLPVICVGNLAVGGTGKTPHTEYLIRLLHREYKIAVLSRGYKRKSKGFLLASSHSSSQEIGDEPRQIAQKFPDIYVAVDKNRCHGIEMLTDGHTAPGIQVIILDDAYQHRYVQAGMNILLTDYHRLFYLDRMLPAGRLREPQSEKRRADVILITKCPVGMDSEEQKEIRTALQPAPGQDVFFTTLQYDLLQPLSNPAEKKALHMLSAQHHILLVSGIANPQPLVDKLTAYTPNVRSIIFADHHNFSAADIQKIWNAFQDMPPQQRLIITTEKDAARLITHPALHDEIKEAMYVLPVSVAFINKEEEDMFNQKITEYVRENSRNSSLFKS